MQKNPYEKPKNKKTKKDYKYPNQPMMNPVKPQQAIYQQPIMGQPQPYNPAFPQQIKVNPQQGGYIYAIPIGPPITVAQPLGPPILVPVNQVTTPQMQTAPIQIVQQPYQQINRKPTRIIIKRYRNDDCCNVF